MEYRIKLDPEKESELLLLLKTWRKLGIIKSYESKGNKEVAEEYSQLNVIASRASDLETTNDFVSQYRDLVD